MTTLTTSFTALNRIALLGWIAVFTHPLWPAAGARITIMMVVLVQCVAYVYFLFLGKRHDAPGESPRGSFFTLAGVVSLFRSPRAVLSGWVHYLAFDLMVALYILNDAGARGITHLWLLPALFMTLMFGPAGLLIYLVLRGFLGEATAGVGLL